MKEAKAEHIAIVAHSYGGAVTQRLVTKELDSCQKRLFAIAFTDSVHSLTYGSYDNREHEDAVRRFFKERARNWVTSDLPLDSPMSSFPRLPDAVRVSAGDTRHEWTSFASITSVFTFFDELYRQRITPSEVPSLPSVPTDQVTTTDHIPPEAAADGAEEPACGQPSSLP
jgi:pimeloyl-ACP methyl ester carboxylesterase